MAFMGPCPTPPAHVNSSLQESEGSILSNGRLSDTSKFVNLLYDLFSEHQKCIREAAQDGQHACDPQDFKMSAYIPAAYIPSAGSLTGDPLRMSAYGPSAEKLKQIETVQAHIQTHQREEIWQITHPKDVGLKPVCCAAPEEPEQDASSHPQYTSEQPSWQRQVTQDTSPTEAQGAQSQQALLQSDAAPVRQATVQFDDLQDEQWGARGSMESHRYHPAPARGGTVSIRSQPIYARQTSRGSFASLSSIASNKSQCAVAFFESHKESFGRQSAIKNIKGSVTSTFSDRNFEFLPRSLLSSSKSQVVLLSLWFEVCVGCLIVANTCIMAVELQYNGSRGGYATKYPTFQNKAPEDWPHAARVFEILERTFTVIFTLEMFFRLSVLRRSWFTQLLNWMDLAFIIISWFDWIHKEAGVMNPMMARLVRLVKLGRGLRVAKLSRMLSSLHLLVRSIIASVSILSWSVCILLIAQCISGMMLCQLVQTFIMNEEEDLEARRQVFAYYGTFSRSMITMFEIHLADFGPACRVLLDYVGEEYAYVFLAYRCFAGFAIINIINAVFVQQTMKVAEADQDVMLNQKRKAVETYTKKVRAFFHILDTDSDGIISVEELRAFEDNPTYQLWMSSLDIEASDLRGLFSIIDTDNDGSITADELILGASRIKGPARSIDMVQVLAVLQRLHLKVDDLIKYDHMIGSQLGSARSSAVDRGSSVGSKSLGGASSFNSKSYKVQTL